MILFLFVVENVIGGRTMYRMDCMRYHNSDHKCLSSHFLRDFYLSKEFCVISREALLMKLSQKMIRLKLAP